MADYYIKQNAAVTPLRARLTDDSGVPASLENGTLQIVITSQLDYTSLIDDTATILVANPDNLDDGAANVQYNWQSGDDIATPGVYRIEWRFTPNGSSNYQTFPGSGYAIMQIVANNQ
jgi:hypothetical protein